MEKEKEEVQKHVFWTVPTFEPLEGDEEERQPAIND